MLDIDLEEELVKKVGGKFALTYLLQRRLVELNRGERPLVEIEDKDLDNRRIACQEILQEKITLASIEEIEASRQEAKKRLEAEAATPPAEAEAEAPAESDESDVYGSDIKKIKEQRIKELSELLNPPKT